MACSARTTYLMPGGSGVVAEGNSNRGLPLSVASTVGGATAGGAVGVDVGAGVGVGVRVRGGRGVRPGVADDGSGVAVQVGAGGSAGGTVVLVGHGVSVAGTGVSVGVAVGVGVSIGGIGVSVGGSGVGGTNVMTLSVTCAATLKPGCSTENICAARLRPHMASGNSHNTLVNRWLTFMTAGVSGSTPGPSISHGF